MNFHKYIITILLNDDERSIEIEKPSFVVGRSKKADICILHDLISREHLRISIKGRQLYVEELGASNGSWLDDVKLQSKKMQPLVNGGKIILGNKDGPALTIKCLFKNEDFTKTKILDQIDFEEATLIRKNPFLEIPQIANNIIPLRKEIPFLKSENEILIKKVSNGSHFSTTESSVAVKSIVEPALFQQMKSLLDSEAEKAIYESKKIAEQIIANANKEASSILSKAAVESAAIKSQANTDIEKNKKSVGKKIKELQFSAKKESEELLHNVSKEIEEKRLNAQSFADELISKARLKASKIQNDTDYITRLKTEEFKKVELENEKNISQLNEVFQDLKVKVDHLRQIERDSQVNYDNLIKNIAREEERMGLERVSLENLRLELAITKKDSEQQLLDLRFEERNTKAQLETALLEQKLQVTQLLSELQQMQILRDSLIPEVASLKDEKKHLQQLNIENQQTLDIMKSEEARAFTELQNLKEQQEKIFSVNENERRVIEAAHVKLALEEQNATLKMNQAEELLKINAERIKQESKDFENRKTCWDEELKRNKKDQLVKLKEEIQKIQNVHAEEVVQLKKQKEKMLKDLEIVKVEIKNSISKNKDDAIAIQKAEIEATKRETDAEVNHLKNKMDKLCAKLTADFHESKNVFSAEIAKMEESKKQIEHELVSLDKKRVNEFCIAQDETRKILEDANRKSSQLLMQTETEVNNQKNALFKLKEMEMEAIKELKDSALKEIYTKRTERAQAVAMNLDILILTEFAKHRNKKINDLFIQNCSKEINTLVFDTLMSRAHADKAKLDSIINKTNRTKAHARVLNKIFKLIIIIAVGISLFVYLPKLIKMPEGQFIMPLLKSNLDKALQLIGQLK